MSQKSIENKFQSALGDYSSSIDDDQLWLEIEDSLPKKKKKRRLLIWLFFGLSTMAIVLLFVLMIPDGQITTDADRMNVDNGANENIIAQNEYKSSILEAKPDNKNQKIVSNAIDNNKLIKQKPKNLAFIDENLQKNKSLVVHQKSDLVSMVNENKLGIENRQNRKEVKVPRVNTLPIVSELFKINEDTEIKIEVKKQKRARPIRVSKKTRSNIVLNYYAGRIDSQQKISSQDAKYVNFGEDYFSQGLSLSYNRFVGSRLYGRVIFSMDKTCKKYADQVTRDTSVESSLGIQVLSSTEFGNGVIDTESGIPIVNGTYNRDVLKLNTMTLISAGLGFGYEQSIGKWIVNLEADIQKSFYYDLSGFGREDSEDEIRDLDSFENYFSPDSKYTVNSQLNLDLAVSKSVSISAGFQYQIGLSSILIEQTKHTEKINLLRASIGLKKEL